LCDRDWPAEAKLIALEAGKRYSKGKGHFAHAGVVATGR